MNASILAGQLVVGGFAGTTLSPTFRGALANGERGGAVIFKRNIDSVDSVVSLTREIMNASPPAFPPLILVDQEGGRVARLGSPALKVPAMRILAASGDEELLRRVAHAQALELAALGFTMNASPVLDVDTNPDNPIIGDRSFSRDPKDAARLAIAYAKGLAEGGVLSCGKHFPGHGDTSQDSHLTLPRVAHARARLDRVEIEPFRLAAIAKMDAFMTAHVVFDALDPGVPATQSHAICTDLLRRDLGFLGVLISDDLEMKAITMKTGEAAISSIRAGCDLLLVCSDEERQEEAVEALTHEIESSPAFHARAKEAHARGIAMRKQKPPRPRDTEAIRAIFATNAKLREELALLAASATSAGASA